MVQSSNSTLVEGRRRAAWLAPALVLVGTGWGSNQFTPMLLVYRQALGLGTGTLEALFGFYALGLIPGLLIAGPLSDARGRRAVVIPAAGLSFVASAVLVAGAHSVALLSLGRVLAGLSSGAVFAAGTAWLREASVAPFGTASPDGAARRAAVAMTLGFAGGPLVAGLLAQWGPADRVVPYVPHLVLAVVVLLALARAPETLAGGGRRAMRQAVAAARTARFRGVVAPMAPWVFASAAVAIALLPGVVGAGNATDAVAIAGLVSSLGALSGVAAQPLARRLGSRPPRNAAAVVGLVVVAAGMALGAATVAAGQTWMLVPCAIVLGSGYGMCLVAGLIEVQQIADAESLGGLTAIYYALTYLGFAAPYAFALGSHAVGYPVLLGAAAALALVTATVVARNAAAVDGRSPVTTRTGHPVGRPVR